MTRYNLKDCLNIAQVRKGDFIYRIQSTTAHMLWKCEKNINGQQHLKL